MIHITKKGFETWGWNKEQHKYVEEEFVSFDCLREGVTEVEEGVTLRGRNSRAGLEVTMKKLLILVAIMLLLTEVARTQQFSCPSSSAGCNSYRELVAANDKNVNTDSVHYACFPDDSSDFFIVYFGYFDDPYTFYKWNHLLAVYTINYLSDGSVGIVGFDYYKNGVENGTTEPSNSALGRWKIAYDSGMRFVSTASTTMSVSMDDNQIVYFHKYKSIGEKDIDYTLTIQLSTKRFVGQYNVEHNPTDNFDITGRCAEIRPFPKLPSAPPLTQEQQDEQKKMSYCSGTSDQKDLGYCASSFTYPEDYQAAHGKKAKHPRK